MVKPPTTVVFVPTGKGDGLYDLQADRRGVAYDLEPEEFAGALRRSRLDLSEAKVFVEDETGYRTPLTRR